jgi:ABC-type transport system involved in cytochrome c biogenesis permease component
MILQGLLIAGLFRIAEIHTEYPEKLAAAVLLVNLLFAGILSAERIFLSEKANGCIKGLLLSPAASGEIYFAKFGFDFLLLCLSGVVIIPVLVILFCPENTVKYKELLFSLILINISLAAVVTMLGFLIGGTGRNSLLSVVFIPVILPVFVPGFNMISYCFSGNGQWNQAARFIVCFDVIFLTLCWLLFDFIIEEK